MKRFGSLKGYLMACLVGLFGASLLFAAPAASPVEPQLLEPEQAFQVSARWHDAGTIEINYAIADGYYMYRERFAFLANGKAIDLGKTRLPPGKRKQDATFGNVVIYRNSVRLLLPVAAYPLGDVVTMQATSQGCADVGICYPPLRQTLRLIPNTTASIVAEPGVATDRFSRPTHALDGLVKKAN